MKSKTGSAGAKQKTGKNRTSVQKTRGPVKREALKTKGKAATRSGSDFKTGKAKKILTEGNLILVRGWCMDGITNEDIAERLGISKSTFYAWAKKFSDFSDSLKNTKEIADMKVENALFKAALSGNVTAMAIWLNNRMPDKWRQKQKEYIPDESESGVVILPDVIDAEETEATDAGDMETAAKAAVYDAEAGV